MTEESNYYGMFIGSQLKSDPPCCFMLSVLLFFAVLHDK